MAMARMEGQGYNLGGFRKPLQQRRYGSLLYHHQDHPVGVGNKKHFWDTHWLEGRNQKMLPYHFCSFEKEKNGVLAKQWPTCGDEENFHGRRLHH
jgi:hypothetical protein